LATAAARPDPRAKEDGWRQVFDVSRSLAERRAIMTGLQQPGQKEVLAPYIDRYFTELRGVWATAGPEFALAFTRALYPRFSGAEHQVLSRTEAGLQDRQLVPEMVRVLREEQAELTRALATRTCDSAAGIGPPHRDVAHG
jgi:aminopeptidase N